MPKNTMCTIKDLRGINNCHSSIIAHMIKQSVHIHIQRIAAIPLESQCLNEAKEEIES